MVITDKFVWLHFPKCAGTEVSAVLKALNIPDSHHDPIDYNKIIWHHTLAQRQKYDPAFNVEGKRVICCFRRLPYWILSRIFYEFQRSYHVPTREMLLKGMYIEQPGYPGKADAALTFFRPGVTDWLRTENLVEDFTRVFSDLIDLTDVDVSALFQRRHTRIYLKNPKFYFTAKELAELYDHNPVWKELELELYGNLMTL